MGIDAITNQNLKHIVPTFALAASLCGGLAVCIICIPNGPTRKTYKKRQHIIFFPSCVIYGSPAGLLLGIARLVDVFDCLLDGAHLRRIFG